MPSSAGEGAGFTTARLAVGTRGHDRSIVISPAGELDHDSVGLLHERLDAALARLRDHAANGVVVDCRELRFCDSTGLNALLGARLDVEAAGGSLVLTALRPAVARVFEITGADTVFDIRPDLSAVITH
ncbi:STAS domain-containing protein [Kitasatospora sp. NPDC052896]|uniref:STAS domain-containing protein n=1 Tax=Kitasatospora sp. NPDC052896 TaxID=3364061 RepID=UPI0037C52827